MLIIWLKEMLGAFMVNIGVCICIAETWVAKRERLLLEHQY